MRHLSALWLVAALLGCRIEDHTPTGSRRDEDAVQALVARYARRLSERDWPGLRSLFWRDGSYSGPMVPRSLGQAVPIDTAVERIAHAIRSANPQSFEVRVLRSDFRQDGDLAGVWITMRRRAAGASGLPVERDWVEHLVLRRIGDDWRILSVAGASSPRGSARGPR